MGDIRAEVALAKHVLHERRSGRQGCNPAGESPAVSVARVGYVVMPNLGAVKA